MASPITITWAYRGAYIIMEQSNTIGQPTIKTCTFVSKIIGKLFEKPSSNKFVVFYMLAGLKDKKV